MQNLQLMVALENLLGLCKFLVVNSGWKFTRKLTARMSLLLEEMLKALVLQEGIYREVGIAQ